MREFPSRSSSLLLTIAIFFLVIFIPLIFISNYKSFYFSRFEKYEVYDNFEYYDPPILDKQFATIIDYMHLRNEAPLDPSFFSKEDILHMVDVRRLILLMYFISGICSSFILYNIYKYRLTFRTTRALKDAGRALATIAVMLSFYGYMSFQSFFINFHEITFFNNDYWLLDPKTSNLIKFLPIEIFQEIFIFFIISTFIIGVSISILGYIEENRFTNANQ